MKEEEGRGADKERKSEDLSATTEDGTCSVQKHVVAALAELYTTLLQRRKVQRTTKKSSPLKTDAHEPRKLQLAGRQDVSPV